MTKIFLIRHGSNDFIGNRIAGRLPGVHLNADGRAQAERLVPRLKREQIDHIVSSPMERCRETAEPFANASSLSVETCEGVIEVGYGDWSGKTIDELRQQPEWQKWNNCRSSARIPNGETILQIQNRVVGAIQRLEARFPGKNLAVFSHGDPIRSAICFYLGIPLDMIPRFEVSPASVSLLCLDGCSIQVSYINDRTAANLNP